MIEPDRRLDRYRSWPLEMGVFAIVIATFAGTAIWLPRVKEAFRTHGWGAVPVAFVAAPALQVVLLLSVFLAVRWVVRTRRAFTQSWRTQRLFLELREGLHSSVPEGTEVADEAAVVIEERARRSIVRFLTFLALLLALQLAYLQFIVLSLASNHNPSRIGTLVVAVLSALMVLFVLVMFLRGSARRKR